MRRDREDELDLADIGEEAPALQHRAWWLLAEGGQNDFRCARVNLGASVHFIRDIARPKENSDGKGFPI
jgi:hypothetical protein